MSFVTMTLAVHPLDMRGSVVTGLSIDLGHVRARSMTWVHYLMVVVVGKGKMAIII